MRDATEARDRAISAWTRSQKLTLVAILVLGGSLRTIGLDFGLPGNLRPDEGIYTAVVHDILKKDDLKPGVFFYPALPFYTHLAAAALAHGVEKALGHCDQLTLEGRFESGGSWPVRVQRGVSAILGTLTILVTALLARRVSSNSAGVAAAALLAIAPLHVRHSHFGTLDIGAAFWTTLAFLALARAADRGSSRAYAIAGVATGVATASRYLPVILALPLTLAAMWARPLGSMRDRWIRLGLAGAGCLLGFFLICPFIALHWSDFLSQVGHLAGGGVRGPLSERLSLIGISGLWWGLGPVAALSLIGAIDLGVRGRASARVLSLGFVLGISAVVFVRTPYLRHILPFVPAAIVCAMAFLVRLVRVVPWSPALALATVALGAFPFHESLQEVRLFAKTTSYDRLRTELNRAPLASLKVAFTDPFAAEILQLPKERLLPFDPIALVDHLEPVLVVVVRNPIPIMTPVVRADELFASSTTSELRLRIDPNPRASPAIRYENGDACVFPISGSADAEFGGPLLEVISMTGPRRVMQNAAIEWTPKPSSGYAYFEALPFRALVVSWELEPTSAPLGWYVRLVPDGAVTSLEDLAAWPRIALPGGMRLHTILDAKPGSYHVAVSGVSAAREGEPLILGPLIVGE